MHVCAPYACLVSEPLSLTQRMLWATMWVLVLENGSSWREAGDLNQWAISSAPEPSPFIFLSPCKPGATIFSIALESNEALRCSTAHSLGMSEAWVRLWKPSLTPAELGHPLLTVVEETLLLQSQPSQAGLHQSRTDTALLLWGQTAAGLSVHSVHQKCLQSSSRSHPRVSILEALFHILSLPSPLLFGQTSLCVPLRVGAISQEPGLHCFRRQGL